MTNEERDDICRAIAVSCMWGQGGIASVILEELQRRVPLPDKTWAEAYNSISKAAQRDSVGVVTEQSDLDWHLQRGYWLANFDADGCALFNPPPMNGLSRYVSKELADAYKAQQDKMSRLFRQMAEASVPPINAPATSSS
jgi:hypothetical protein